MDFLIAIVELIGSWVVGNKNRQGFILLMISNASWIVYVLYEHKVYGLLVVVIPAFFINVRNFIKWFK